MRTPFKPFSNRLLLAMAGCLAMTGCILPGPWDYTVQDKPTFHGIFASVYAVADRPVQNACFERLLDLSEGHSNAFPFYDSAAIGIEGLFSIGGTPAGQTTLLQPLFNTPNCFSGDSSVKFLRGEAYRLTARFVWDSAGTAVTTVLTAQAKIPAFFRISDTAAAPRMAEKGFAAAQIPGADIAKFKNDLIPYRRGDSLFYIGGSGEFNNLSHYFHSKRSDEVSGVLVTQRYDTTAGRPITSFDIIAGFKPDTAEFYYPGDHRRLILDPSTVSQSGYNLLDSIGVVNAWFWSGRNRLYFYGVERAYTEYNFTNVQEPGGGPVDQNPKIKPLTNVAGGRGFFAGMIVDSFDVFIKTDSLTAVYPYPAARAWTCRDKGWFGSRDCAGWYREFCRDNRWQREDCRLDAIYACADSAEKLSAPAGLCDSALVYAAFDPVLKLEALRRYCTDWNYPANVPECAAVKQECETGTSGNGCHLVLWKSCELDYWKPAACVEGRKSYCKVYGSTQIELCRGVK